ncbi:MAG: RNA 2'-phosphotransferase [Desulfobacterales bacterium]
MTRYQQLNKLAKFLSYVLGRRPDEFGLVPDPEGYVKIKDLLKALCEEDGWRHVRRASLDEICLSLENPVIEISENRIRAADRESLSLTSPAENLPKLLYTCIRQRAHHHVVNRGIFPAGTDRIILSPDPDMALRMGKRIDSHPVQLTVHAHSAVENGSFFEQYGGLYISEFIPVGCFTAPPLPREKTDSKSGEAHAERPEPIMPGSFLINTSRVARHGKPNSKDRKPAKQPWKKDRKQMRKHKEKMWPV